MNYNPFSLNDKTIFVTGSSSGIGASIACEASRMGANVIVTGRNSKRLENVFNQLWGISNNKIIADLSKDNDLDKIVQSLPVLDGVVLNAGIIKTLPVRNINNEAIEEIFQTNIISSIKLLSHLLKKRKISKGASIIFISSVSTFNVKVGNSLYSATKGAVNSFAKTMALEVARQSIRVNCIQPGFIPTEILDKSGLEKETILDWYKKRHPLGIGSPQDIAQGCVYLLSDASKWVTGSIFTIDGGYTLQ